MQQVASDQGHTLTNADLGLPDFPPSEHMINALFDCGPVLHDGAGPRPIQWRDALAYGQCTDAISEPWEYRTLCQMSMAYLSELQAAGDALRIPPCERDEMESPT